MKFEDWHTVKFSPEQRFGILTIIKTVKRRRPNTGGYAYYVLCKCDCGSPAKPVGISDIGSARSCGCIKSGYRKGEPHWTQTPEGRAKNSALHKGQQFVQPFRAMGNKHPNWKGGKTQTSDGYVLIKPPNINYPNQKAGGYIYEHRYKMEQHLGRYLERFERVHHINGDVSDNRLENLVLCQSQSNHFKKFHNKIVNDGIRIYGPSCPRCHSSNTGSRGKTSYKCYSCNRRFAKSGKIRK
jgi:hypothetical protein